MKITPSPADKVPSRKKWMGHIRKTVEVALLGAGILSGTIAHAQESTKMIKSDPLEQAQNLAQFYLRQNQKLKGTVESLWSNLQQGDSSVPNTLFDDHHNLTPEALQWISETLPKEHIGLATDLIKAQEKLSELPKDSIGRAEQLAIVFVSLTLLLAFIIYGKGEFKNKKERDEFYKYCSTLAGETDIEKIKAFFEGTDDDSNEDKSADAIKRDREIGSVVHTMKLRSQLEELPENALCIFTDNEQTQQFFYVNARKKDADGAIHWQVTSGGGKYTITLSPDNTIDTCSADNEHIVGALKNVASIQIIGLEHGKTPRSFDQHSRDNPFGVNEWYLKEFGIIEGTLKTGERLLVRTYSGAVYIIEVQADQTFRVLPETPNGNLSTNTILQGFDVDGNLKTQDGTKTTSRVTNMLRLDTPISAQRKYR